MGCFRVLFVLMILFVSFSGASENTYNGYRDSLVTLKEADESSMKGSGFVYGSDGYIITNNHIVVENGVVQDLEVRFNGSDEWTEVRMLGRDPATDLAILKANNLPLGIEGLQISNSTPEIGQSVSILGNPLGVEGMFTTGEIVDISETVTTKEGVTLEDSIVISATVEPGSSGGPVLVSEGKVIGVISARNEGEGLGFAIPASTLRNKIPQMRNQTIED